MSFWSSEKIREINKTEGLISPYSPTSVVAGAYELTLGEEFFLTSDDDGLKNTIANNEQITIPPGQFGLLITEESVKIPAYAIGFISIKANVKFRGLVNISGFHVDPGFSGCLKFSVFNAGAKNIILQRGLPLFLIWFADLDRTTLEPYKGDHQNQSQITPDDVMRIHGDFPSPIILRDRINELEKKFKIWGSAALAILLPTLVSNIKSCSSVPSIPLKEGSKEPINLQVETNLFKYGGSKTKGKND